MNLIRMRGPEEVIGHLDEVTQLIIIEHSGKTLPTGEVQLSGYATDEAINEIELRGATVEVLIDNATLKARQDELDAIIESSEPVG